MAKNKTNIRRRTRRRSHRRSGRKTKVHNKSKKYRKQRKLRGGETYAPTDWKGRTKINQKTQKHIIGSQPGSKNRIIQKLRAREAAAAESDAPSSDGRNLLNKIRENAAKVTNKLKAKVMGDHNPSDAVVTDNSSNAVVTNNPAFGQGM